MSDPAIPPELSAKYALRGTLGRGASGVVLDAFDRLIQRRVAIKLVQLPPRGEAEAAETHQRFRREAQAAGRLSHPGIVAVYDYGENDGQAWIVMERVGGGTLKALLDSGVRLPVAEASRIAIQVLEALAYSHARGVVHRDIKPANIMLDDAEDGTAPRVKITDFGISRLEDSAITRLGTVLGTPSSMAPEQLRGEPADHRADIWAAGTVLYQLLTGEKAFSGGFQAVMHKVLHTEPVAPSLLSDSLPRGFDAVLARALAKRPQDRFQSASDFAHAVAEAARETPPPAFAGAGPLPGLEEDADA
ncbi:serine/threonine-protein kinase, partial [Teichococcus cervicalis]